MISYCFVAHLYSILSQLFCAYSPSFFSFEFPIPICTYLFIVYPSNENKKWKKKTFQLTTITMKLMVYYALSSNYHELKGKKNIFSYIVWLHLHTCTRANPNLIGIHPYKIDRKIERKNIVASEFSLFFVAGCCI